VIERFQRLQISSLHANPKTIIKSLIYMNFHGNPVDYINGMSKKSTSSR